MATCTTKRKARRISENGWFHTGDLGHIDTDGYFWFAERSKDMIKRSGFNVAPAEVERVIRELPEVDEVGGGGSTRRPARRSDRGIRRSGGAVGN